MSPSKTDGSVSASYMQLDYLINQRWKQLGCKVILIVLILVIGKRNSRISNVMLKRVEINLSWMCKYVRC